MKIGLLGIDRLTAAVAAAAREEGDSIPLACDLPSGWSAAWLDSATHRTDSWQQLLDDKTCDAVLVGGDGWSDARADAVRGLVQAGRPLLLSHPLALSMLWAYELDMIRGDSGTMLIPMLPDRLHPFVGRLRDQVEAGVAQWHPRGSLEAITLERRMDDRSREAVLRQLARDADLIRVLVGDPQRLATLGGTIESAWPTLAVECTGSSQVPVRWHVARGDAASLTIRLIHDRGATTVTIPDDDRPWSWHDDGGGPGTTAEPFDRSRVMLALLRDERDRSPSGRRHSLAVPPAEWADAARAIELAETVPRSLAKGRAIDLHQEEFSEIGTFKGTMASLGCGIVLAALMVLVLAALVGGIARESGWAIGERIAGAWPLVVLSALVLFLALQVLPLVVGDKPGRGGPKPDSSPTRDGPATRP